MLINVWMFFKQRTKHQETYNQLLFILDCDWKYVLQTPIMPLVWSEMKRVRETLVLIENSPFSLLKSCWLTHIEAFQLNRVTAGESWHLRASVRSLIQVFNPGLIPHCEEKSSRSSHLNVFTIKSLLYYCVFYILLLYTRHVLCLNP